MVIPSKKIGSYFSDISGNFSVILGVSLSAILMACGAALDVSQAHSIKANYQDMRTQLSWQRRHLEKPVLVS